MSTNRSAGGPNRPGRDTNRPAPNRPAPNRPAPNRPARGPQIEVIAAAFLFSLSVPAGKLLLSRADPLALSGALYLSAGVFSGVLALLALSRNRARRRSPLRPGEWLALAGAVAAGGVLAPLALFAGLRLVAGHVAGLLLNFETLFTIVLGIVLSREHLGRRAWLGAVTIVGGALLLSWGSAGTEQVDWRGVALVIAACALWGIDNNLTQRISIRDARAIVAVKGLVGGSTSLLLALALGRLGAWSAPDIIAAGVLGAASFGASIALFVRGLRRIGVVQTGILFSLAPGMAAVISWLLLGEALAAPRILAFALMGSGALLLMSESHEHIHVHEALDHDHAHEHDAHHAHDHGFGREGRDGGDRDGRDRDGGAKRHAHPHHHDPLTHTHPHAHDIHHRHRN